METLKIIIDSQAKDDGLKQTDKGLKKLTGTAKTLVGAFAALKTAQAAVDFAKVGASADRQANSLDALAQSAGTSGKAIIDAMQGASDYTIDRMTAMQAANKAMLLDVAKSPDEFARLAKVATALGRAMGQDAAKSIEDFTVAAGRQSKMIADNLGLMVGAEDANQRYAKSLGVTADQLTDAQKKQAFLTEMLRQGEAKMAEMGDSTLDTAGKFEQMSARLADTKTNAALLWANFLDATGVLDGVNAAIEDLSENMEELQTNGELAHKAVAVPPGNAKAVEDLKAQYEDLNRAKQEEARWSQYGLAWEKKLANQVKETDTSISYLDASTLGLVKTDAELMRQITRTQAALEAEANAADKSAISFSRVTKYTLEARTAMNNLGMSLSSYLRQTAQQQTDAANDIEEIEAEHQEKLLQIQARGQAVSIKFDEAAEQEKLEKLQTRLAIALQQQAEFTDKTKESSRMSKEAQIADLQGQVAAQTTLLDDYYAGRLVKQGANIGSELAAENERYEEAFRLAQEQHKLQEEEQRRSLGQIALQHFDTWAAMNGVTGEQAYAMRVKIQEEYGLITAGGADMAMSWSESWAAMKGGTDVNLDSIIAKMKAAEDGMGSLRQAILNLPDKTVNIDVKINKHSIDYGGTIGEQGVEAAAAAVGPTVDTPIYGSGQQYATGTTFARGGLALVGEQGPELVNMPRGAQVYSAMQTKTLAGGAFQSSRGQLRVPGMQLGRRAMAGEIGGGSFSQVWHNSFYLMETDAELLAKKIAEAERLKGVRKVA